MSDEDKNNNVLDSADDKEQDVDNQDTGDEGYNDDDSPFFNFPDEKEKGSKEEKGDDQKEEDGKKQEEGEKEYVSREELDSLKREQEVNDFLNNPKNEDYKEFAGKIKEAAKRPEAQGLTPQALAKMVVPVDFWIKKGAQMGNQADAESKQTYTTGRAARDEVGKTKDGELPDPYSIKDDAEFMREAERIARESAENR